MKKTRMLTIGMSSLLLCSLLLINNVYADRTGGGKGGKPSHAPEPVSCALLLAGGATLAALRRWKSKKSSKNLHNKSV